MNQVSHVPRYHSLIPVETPFFLLHQESCSHKITNTTQVDLFSRTIPNVIFYRDLQRSIKCKARHIYSLSKTHLERIQYTLRASSFFFFLSRTGLFKSVVSPATCFYMSSTLPARCISRARHQWVRDRDHHSESTTGYTFTPCLGSFTG